MDILRFLARRSPRLAKRMYRRIFGDEQWFFAVNAGAPLADFGMNGRTPMARLKVHHAPPGRFWADPIPIVIDGKVWVFFEDYSFASQKAVIACAPVSPDGELGEVVTALECPYHLSYPFVFEHGGELYMLPETWDEHRVDLWRCRRFPRRLDARTDAAGGRGHERPYPASAGREVVAVLHGERGAGAGE